MKRLIGPIKFFDFLRGLLVLFISIGFLIMIFIYYLEYFLDFSKYKDFIENYFKLYFLPLFSLLLAFVICLPCFLFFRMLIWFFDRKMLISGYTNMFLEMSKVKTKKEREKVYEKHSKLTLIQKSGIITVIILGVLKILFELINSYLNLN